MKRYTFLASILTISVAPLMSFPSIHNFIQTISKGFKIKSGEGRIHGHIKLKGVNSNLLDVKISGSDTKGELAIFEQTSLSQGRGTPFHVHFEQDEVFYVLQGSYRFKVGNELYDLTVGDSIFLPRQIPHAWTQISKTGKMTVTVQPAGKLENFFIAMAAFEKEPTSEEVAAIFASNEMKIVGPPLKIE